MANRFHQSLLIISAVGLSWLLMMALHECGHVLHGWLSGAELANVYVPPIGFSRTEFAVNPYPLFVVWGGPLWGCLLPLSILAGVQLLGATNGRGFMAVGNTASVAARRYGFLIAWFAGFCLIVNGGYLAGGVFLCHGGADDPSVILQHGGARWQLLAFGAPAIAAGLYLWNGLGPNFGLGPARGRVDRKAAVGVAVAFLLALFLTLLLGT